MKRAKCAMGMLVGAVTLGGLATAAAAEGEGSYVKIPSGDGYVSVMTHPLKETRDLKTVAVQRDMPKVEGVVWHSSALRPTDDSGHGSRLVNRPTDDSGHGSRLATVKRPADTAHGSRLTGIRAHKPLMTAAMNWRECEVGANFDHILVGASEGKDIRLDKVQVVKCSRERVSFSYEKIKY